MKKRIISALVLLAVIIPLYLLGGIIWAMAVGLVSVLTLKETLDLKNSHVRYPGLIQLLAVICELLLVYTELNGYDLTFGISYVAMALTFLILLVPTLFIPKYATKDAFYLIGVIIFLGTIFNSFILFNTLNQNKLIFVYLILIATLSDTFSMVIGNLIGKRKLSSADPDKTLEGAIGGLVISSIASFFYVTFIASSKIPSIIIMTIFLNIVAIVGDLIFNKIKRENDIKKFSNILPGHGGILDRLDSIIFTVLAYIIIITIA